MKNIFKILALAVTTVVMVTACTKVADLPYYENGNPVTLTANKTAVTATPADSLNAVISFSWSNPEYKQDSSLYKFVLEIDSTDGTSPRKP
jgi:hypothetical protein